MDGSAGPVMETRDLKVTPGEGQFTIASIVDCQLLVTRSESEVILEPVHTAFDDADGFCLGVNRDLTERWRRIVEAVHRRL